MARVVALADAFDAMTSDRPYRKGVAPVAAFAEIQKMSGSQFDPHFTAAFLSIQDDIVREMKVGVTTRPPEQRTKKVPTCEPTVRLS